jgi:hypothetical protein
LLANWHGIGTPLPFVRGLETTSAATEVDDNAPAAASLDSGQTVEKPAHSTPRRDKLRPERADEVVARNRAEERRRERSLVNDTFRIHFGGHPTYIQLLTHPDDLRKALFHEQLRVGYDDHGLTLRRSFVSPRDPNLADPDGPDPVTARTLSDGGYPPADKIFAWAVQLRKTQNDFEVATRIEDGQEVENVGLIVQAATNFFHPLSQVPDVTRTAVKVVRKKDEKHDQDEGREHRHIRMRTDGQRPIARLRPA